MKQKPFIPAWLDEAGLTAAEMRVFVHLLRSADNNTGVAWPSYRRMTEITGMSKSTIRRCIESLEDHHKLITKIGKPFAGSCRYRVLPIVPPEGQKDTSISSTTGTNEAAPIVPPEADNSSTRGTPIVSPEGQEGYPKKVIQRRKSTKSGKPSIEPSLESIQFAQWFKSSLPQAQQDGLPKNWLKNYCKSYDEMIRLDNKTPEQIREVCRWARTDEFWKQQIRTPGKLRERDKQGTKYFDVLTERMKQPTGPTSKPTAPVNTGRRTSDIEEL